MKKIFALLLLSFGSIAFAQSERTSGMDHATIKVIRNGDTLTTPDHFCGPLPWPVHVESADAAPAIANISPDCLRMQEDRTMGNALAHPYHWEARHPKIGCDETAKCGEIFSEGWGENLRPSAGATWQANIMADTATPPTNLQCNYLALTNTAITPAYADTTLSGEIVSNGLARAQATYTNNSSTLTVPSAPTSSVIGTPGSTTYYYWVAACRQGICTTPSVTSGSVTTANATLSTTNYVSVVFTGISGADSYQVYRTTSNSAPTGTSTVLVGGAAACTTATSANCTVYDQSNTLTSVVIPGSNLTYFGTYSLVHLWTATGAQSAQAFGVFTASSSGVMCFEGVFSPVSLNVNDTFQLTEQVFF